jgi:hypothetical protein
MLFLIYFSAQSFRATEMYVPWTIRERKRHIPHEKSLRFSLVILGLFVLSLVFCLGAYKNNILLCLGSAFIAGNLTPNLTGDENFSVDSHQESIRLDWLLTALLNISFYLLPVAVIYIIFNFVSNI